MSGKPGRLSADYRRLRNFLLAAYAVVVLATMGLLAGFLWSDYMQRVQAAVGQATTLTRALEEHVLRTFTFLDTRLRNAGGKLAESGALDRPGSPELIEQFRRDKPAIDFVRSMYAYDADGRGHTTSMGADIRHLDARRSEQFRRILETRGDQLEIGRAEPGPVSGRPSIAIARGIVDAQGRFRGIIGIAIEPAYFQEFYRSLDVGEGRSLALVRKDGPMLARFPDIGGAAPDISGVRTFRERVAVESSGTVEVRSVIDGSPRLLAFRHVRGLPLIVVNSIDQRVLAAPVWQAAWRMGSILASLLAILAILLRMAIRELSRRARAEQELRDQTERFRIGQAAARMIVLDWDVRTNKLAWSDSPEWLLGPLQADQAAYPSFEDMVHPEDREYFREVRDRALSTLQGQMPEYRIVRTDGAERWIAARCVVLADDARRPYRMLVALHDITDRKAVENALKLLNDQLERRVEERTCALAAANQELETFTYSVSHDLKAPLRGIVGYARLLEEQHAGKLDAEAMQFLRNVRQAALHMDSLIGDLLAYSRLERLELRSTENNLSDVVNRLMQERSADIAASGAQVLHAFPRETAIRCDREALTVAMRNLFENALKFSRDSRPPVVEIGARQESGRWVLWIKDNGIGFDPRFHDRIFTIFQRLHRSEDYPGTGVGLAIVKKAAERMGGRAWAESSMGAGSQFFIEVPT